VTWGALSTASNLTDVKKDLAELGISAAAIGSPLAIMTAIEENRTDKQQQIKDSENDLDNKKLALPSLMSLKTDLTEIFTLIARFGFAIVLFFLGEYTCIRI
jgi:hypothetical protein